MNEMIQRLTQDLVSLLDESFFFYKLWMNDYKTNTF